MNKTYTTKAIILNRKDIREADRLFILYTKEYGKIEAIATSAKKATSKMAKFLEPLMEIELLLARGRVFDKIAEVKLIDNFTELKQDQHQWALGCYCLEVIDRLIKVDHPQAEIFDLLHSILNLLKQENNHLVQFFVWQLLAHLGYRPELEKCVICNWSGEAKLRHSSYTFNPHKGGILCTKCLIKEKNNIKITPTALNTLKQALENNLTDLQKININQNDNSQMNQAISSLLNYHLDYELKSGRFLRG